MRRVLACCFPRQAAAEWGLQALCTEDVVLWLYICAGRVLSSSRHHLYLRCLPHEAPDPACWVRMSPTPLRAVSCAHHVRTQCAGWLRLCGLTRECRNTPRESAVVGRVQLRVWRVLVPQ